MIKSSFLKSKLFQNISKLTLGNGFGELLVILSVPVISRIYTPKEIGIFMFFFSISDILSNIVIGKYESAIIISKNKKEAINIVISTISLTLINSVILSLFFLFFGKYFINYFGFNDISEFSFLSIPLLITSLNFYKIIDHWNNYNRNYLIMAYSKFLQKVLLVTIQIIFSFFGFFGLLIGRFISQILSGFYLLIRSLHLISNFNFKELSIKSNFDTLKKYSEFPIFYLPSNLSNRISYNLPNITFSKLFNTEITGLYSLSYRLLASPMGIIMSAIGQVFYKEASVIHTKNTKKLYTFLKNFYLNTFLIGIIPFAILFFISPYLFPIILGDEWKMSGIYIQLLIPWLFLVFLNSPVTSILIILKKQKELFYYEFTSMITRVIVVVLSALFLKNSLYTVGLYSLAGFLFSLFLLIYIIKTTQNCSKI